MAKKVKIDAAMCSEEKRNENFELMVRLGEVIGLEK